MKKGICFLILCVLCVTFLAGCNSGTEWTQKNDPAYDAPASTEYVMVIQDEKIYETDFIYLFTAAINEIGREASGYPASGTAQQKYDFLNRFLFREKNGTTPFQIAMDNTLNRCQQLVAMLSEAREKNALMTETKKAELFAEIDKQINYNMVIHADKGLDSRDAVCRYITGMNVNEYKRFALLQKNAEGYAAKLMQTYHPSEKELLVFYREKEADYQMRTIRKIFIAETADGSGRQKAREVYSLVKNETYPMSVIAKGWSEESNAVETEGIYHVTAADTVLEPAIRNWALNRTAPMAQKEATLFEIAGKGYYIVTCEQVHTYETSEAMQEAVLTGFRKARVWEHAEALVASGEYALSEFSREAVETMAKEFLAEMNPSD